MTEETILDRLNEMRDHAQTTINGHTVQRHIYGFSTPCFKDDAVRNARDVAAFLATQTPVIGTQTLELVKEVCQAVAFDLRSGDTDNAYMLKQITSKGVTGFIFTTTIMVNGRPVEVSVRSK